MGCIHSKKLVKINSSPLDDSKNGSNNIAIHNIRKETRDNNEIISKNKINIDNKENNLKLDDKMIHSNSQTFKIKTPINDNISKSNQSKKNSSYYNHSMSNSEENAEVFKLTSNINNNNKLINKDLKFQDKYTILNEVNCDSYFKTFKIKLIDEKLKKGEFRSMIKIDKEIFGEFASDKKIQEEVALLSKFDSKYIIKVYECFISNKRYYLITDHCEYGSLNEKLKNGSMYNESQIRYLVMQIFKAIKYLNSKNFLHIEISPEKILIDNITHDSHGEEMYNIKLLDFFFPSQNNALFDNKVSFFCYTAPEVLEQKYSPTCDIWSIGIIIFQMFFGELPYKNNNDFKEYVKIIKSTYKYCDNVSNEFKDLLDKMLNKNPLRRINIDECLSHPWIHKQNTEIIFEEEEENKQQLVKTKTKHSKIEKIRKKSSKTGKITNLESKKGIYYSENNSYKTSLIEMPLNIDSSSISSDSISNDNYKNRNNITNESTKEKIRYHRNYHSYKKNNFFHKSNNNLHYKFEFKQKLKNHNSFKRLSSCNDNKNKERKNEQKYPILIEKTVEYIEFFICINFHKKKEMEKISKIFKELDTLNDNYLLYDKVHFASEFYKNNKDISIENFKSNEHQNINNDKIYNLEDFINILIDEKNQYINDNLKNIFNSIKQPNLEELIKIYKEQEAIGAFRKYNIYINEIIKIIQDNITLKTNYFYNEFKTIIDNTINKLYTNNINKKNEKSQNKGELQKAYSRKVIKITKNKNPIKLSNSYLTYNHNINKKNELINSEFNPDNFLKLIKK